MRKFKFTLIAFMAAMMALSFTAPNTRNQRPFRKISNQEQCSSGYCRTSFQGQQL